MRLEDPKGDFCMLLKERVCFVQHHVINRKKPTLNTACGWCRGTRSDSQLIVEKKWGENVLNSQESTKWQTTIIGLPTPRILGCNPCLCYE